MDEAAGRFFLFHRKNELFKAPEVVRRVKRYFLASGCVGVQRGLVVWGQNCLLTIQVLVNELVEPISHLFKTVKVFLNFLVCLTFFTLRKEVFRLVSVTFELFNFRLGFILGGLCYLLRYLNRLIHKAVLLR